MPSPFRLPQEKRVLFYLEQFGRYSDAWEVPLGASQEGMAKELDILINNVSRTLTSLSSEGLVKERLAHIRGAQRRRNVYFLTPEGENLTRQMKEQLDKEPISYERPDGSVAEVPLSELKAILEREHGISPSYFNLLEFLRDRDRFAFSSLVAALKSRDGGIPKIIHSLEKAPALRQFFGRTKEISRICQAIDSGTSPIIVIQGMAGIGKSALAAKIVEQYRAKKSIYWYRFHEWDSSVSVLSGLAEFLQTAGRNRTHSLLRKGRLSDMNAVASCLELDLDELGALIFMDDLHKCGEQLKNLLSILVEICERLRGVCFIFLTREQIGFYDRRDASLKKTVTEIALSGLDEQSSKSILGPGIDSDKARDIFERTKGHPLFLELISIAGGTLSRKDIDEFIESEILSKMASVERAIIDNLSVYRYPVMMEALAVPGATWGMVSSMEKRGLIRALQEGRFELHDVIRDFAFKRLSQEAIREYHSHAVRYYQEREEVGEISDIEAIYHMQRAQMWREAAALAIERLPSLIGMNYQELLEIQCTFKPQHLPKEQWADLLFLKAEFHMHHEEWYLALNNYLECLAVGESLGSEPGLLAQIHNAIAEVQSHIENWEASRTSHEKALELYEKSGDKLGMARESVSLGMTFKRNKEWDAAMECYNRALGLFDETHQKRGIAAVRNNIGMLQHERGDWNQAVKSINAALDMSVSEGDFEGQAIARKNLAEIFSVRGKWDEAFSNLEEAYSLFRRAGNHRETWEAAERLGDLHEDIEEHGEAVDWYTRGIDAIYDVQAHRGGLFGKKTETPALKQAESRALARLFGKTATVLRETGDYNGCKKNRDEAIRILGEVGGSSPLAREYLEQALDNETLGTTDDGIASLSKAAQILRKEGIKKGEAAVSYNLGRLLEKKGDIEGALQKYSAALSSAEVTSDWVGGANSAEKLASLHHDHDPRRERDLLKKASLYYRYAGLVHEAKRIEQELR